VQALIREVIAAHHQDYAPANGWQEQAVAALVELVPFSYQQLLSELFIPTDGGRRVERDAAPPEAPDRRRLGF
jgi:sugar (pentulose or hexulose) kinase